MQQCCKRAAGLDAGVERSRQEQAPCLCLDFKEGDESGILLGRLRAQAFACAAELWNLHLLLRRWLHSTTAGGGPPSS